METFYWFATLVGWPFALFFVFFGGDIDADVGPDIDMDLDMDLDVDLDVDVDAGGDIDVATGAGPLAAVMSFLSFRSLVFFAAFFGLTGLVLTWMGTNAAGTVVAAFGLGFFAMWVNRALMQYLKRTNSDSMIRDRKVAGSPATVILPISPGQRGRVAVEVQGQRIQLTAGLFSSSDQHEFQVGDTVVIIEIENGAAKVAALDILT